MALVNAARQLEVWNVWQNLLWSCWLKHKGVLVLCKLCRSKGERHMQIFVLHRKDLIYCLWELALQDCDKNPSLWTPSGRGKPGVKTESWPAASLWPWSGGRWRSSRCWSAASPEEWVRLSFSTGSQRWMTSWHRRRFLLQGWPVLFLQAEVGSARIWMPVWGPDCAFLRQSWSQWGSCHCS